jgi:hypothetical protein
MMTLEDLQKDLVAAAGRRGHVMGPFNERGVAECAICLLPLYIKEDFVRGLEVGGGALEIHCDTEVTYLASTGRG